MTLKDLPIDRSVVAKLGVKWSDGGLWDDILSISNQLWEAGEANRLARWHHLLMAVGNFKRQAGRRIHPPRLSDAVSVRPASGRTLQIPGSTRELHRDDPDTWVTLLGVRGMGTATTTTLLAALWPEDHHVLDWRVLNMACVLTLDTPNDLGFVRREDSSGIKPDLVAHYPLVRELLRSFAQANDLALVTVERGLYNLSRTVKTEKGRSWAEYSTAVYRAAKEPLPVSIDGDGSGADEDE